MKKTLAVLAVVLSLGMTAAFDAEAARRLGGGKSSGMQRQNVTQPATQPGTPGSPGQAAPATAGAAAAAAAPAAAGAARRSWMGPLAGLAAGIGLMALASHFGFGEAMANMMMIGLLVMAVLVVVGLVMRKRAAGQNPAMAGAGGVGGMLRQHSQQANTFRNAASAPQRTGSLIGSGIGGAVGATGAVGSIPADFDTAAFERNAKDRFMDLQAANDARDLTRLRDYLTPEMFEVVSADVASRDDTPQATEVFGLEARVLDVVEEADQYIVSVRLTGSVREQHGAVPEDLDEIWHLAKPRTGFGGWVVAGIQQGNSASQH